LVRRWMTRQQNGNVHFPEQSSRFLKMFSGGIFLDERDRRIASFCQFSILSQLGRRLKFRQADVRRGWRSNFAALLLFHCDFLFYKGVVTEPGGAAEDDQCEQ